MIKNVGVATLLSQPHPLGLTPTQPRPVHCYLSFLILLKKGFFKFFAFDRFRKKILEPSLPALLDFTDLSRQELIKGQTKIQGNVNRTRQVLLEGQRDIKSNLKKLAESIATNNKNLADELILAQAKLLYISCAVSIFYGTKIEIWAGLGWLAILKKKFRRLIVSSF